MAASQVAYSEQEVKKILAIRCEEEDVEMDDDALILLTKCVVWDCFTNCGLRAIRFLGDLAGRLCCCVVSVW